MVLDKRDNNSVPNFKDCPRNKSASSLKRGDCKVGRTEQLKCSTVRNENLMQTEWFILGGFAVFLDGVWMRYSGKKCKVAT